MAAGFTRQHLKKTVRRSPRDGRTYLYPQLIGSAAVARRRAIRAQLDIAIRYFESQVGQRRAAFDAEALIGLFEDPRLARGLVAAFARYYRFRRLGFAEVVPTAVAERLQEARLGSPAALRMNLFRYLNTAPRPGFATEAGRPDDIAAFAAGLDVAPGDATELLWLDAESNWVLTRLATPQPADLIAVYDFLTVETFLRYASRLTLEFRAPTPPAVERDVRLLLGHYDLVCAAAPPSPGTGWRLTVHGQADARGSWARHGKRLARLLVRILAAHPGCLESGEAQIELADPAPVLRLDGPVLAALGARQADPAPTDLPVLTPGACAELRAALPDGWGLRLDPDPLVAPAGVLVPPAVAVCRERRVYLVPVADGADLRRLAGLRVALAGRAELLPLLPPGLEAVAESGPAPPSPACPRVTSTARR